MLHRLSRLWAADLAVDLGTANTLVAVPGLGVVLNEPSVVAVAEGTRRVLSDGCAVGYLARQMEGRTPGSMTVARPLAGGVITDFELAEAMLGYFLRKAQRHSGWTRPRTLVAVPGGITPVEKRALFNSAHRSGAGQVYAVEEATAAAIGSGLPVTEPLASMICDIGGGTTEVAVLTLAEIASGRSIRTAGDAMDRAIVDYLRRHYGLRIGTSAAEQLKIEIGSAAPLERERTTEVRGIDAVSGLPRRATVTSEEIREALSEPLTDILLAIHEVLDGCSPDLAADLVDHGLMLAGGGALLEGLDRFFNEQTGLPTRLAPEPQLAVAQGTLICLEHFDHWRGILRSSDDDV